jgi:UDP-N-acetyl-D-mannosaminuronic acid dehydrogenase
MTLDATNRDGLYRSERTDEQLREAVATGDVPVAVYGLGKMGLPLATVFAERTGNVTGVDVDSEVVESINDGRAHVSGEPGLDGAVADAVAAGALEATTDGTAAATAASLHVVIVPTLVDDHNEPDLTTLEAAVDTVAKGLAPGDVVIVESTVPPRTCRDVVYPRLLEASDVDAGEFGLAFCPERTSSGTALADIRGTHPKIVGGVDDESTAVATGVYDVLTDNDVLQVTDATTAECVKVFEGVYRDVNIALANELGQLADELDVDVLEAIQAANTQPYCELHTPGAGVGGHCIPIYPHFLIGGCETETPLLERARAVNEAMPSFVVDRLASGLAERGLDLSGARVGLLGVTYRPGIDEIRKSPAIPIAAQLRDRGASVLAADPVCSSMEAVPAEPADHTAFPDQDLDAVVLVTAHEAFAAIDWNAFDPLVIVDGRQELSLDGHKHVVYTVGRGFTREPTAGDC